MEEALIILKWKNKQEIKSKIQLFRYSPKLTKQRSCYITYTNDTVHEILRTGFDKSPMFNGTIQSIGPRYCPSIEDKINSFAERNRHQLFAEPEGWNTVEVYVNGFSSSLPEDVQLKALHMFLALKKLKFSDLVML